MKSTPVSSYKAQSRMTVLAAGLAVVAISASTAVAQVTLTCPPDMTVSNDPGVCSAVVFFPGATLTGTNGTETVTVSPSSGSEFPVGTTAVNITVTDVATNVLASCSFNVTVLDTEPPVITGAAASRSLLWPPNHKMARIAVDYESTDNCGTVSNCSLTVVSSEAANEPGSGNTSSDWEVVDEHHVRLRAERSGRGGGRTYTITITCADEAGNSASQDVTVFVPHDRGHSVDPQGGNGNGNGDGNGNGHGHGHGHGP